MTAMRLIDVLLEDVVHVDVDRKLFPSDIFDDLTTVDRHGARVRAQFKNRDAAEIPLPLDTFKGRDKRGLGLKKVFACTLADRKEFNGVETLFRVVLRDAQPSEPALTRVLRPITENDPGPFVQGMRTLRMRFDLEALWPPGSRVAADGADDHFAFLRYGSFEREDLEEVCQRLVIEVSAPRASFNLQEPDEAEQLILDRVRSDLGAGVYPNIDRSAVDVAAALIIAANRARIKAGEYGLTVGDLLSATQLRTDRGAVARAHPVESSLEVTRRFVVETLSSTAESLAMVGGVMTLVGPPGQGKSWICHQLRQSLEEKSWAVAEHYCFLDDADGERSERVRAQSIFGSLLARLAEHNPSLVANQRPRFAADEATLITAVQQATLAGTRVALIIDGLDHISRVGVGGQRLDPGRAVVELLAALEIPAGCVLILISQPGDHLKPLPESHFIAAPPMGREEIRLLAERVDLGTAQDDSLDGKTQETSAIVEAIFERSSGNALYATYLCREALRSPSAFDLAQTIRQFPSYDGSLESYYTHLVRGLESSGWVADVLSVLEFSVTREQLREIQPQFRHRVDAALDVLKPVLTERVGQGGVRVYHESFARFLRRELEQDPEAMLATLKNIVGWLRDRGLFADTLAYRFLIPTLARAGADRDAVALIEPSFVTSSIAGWFSPDAIIANLSVAIGCATRSNDWPAVIRCVELANAARAFESERLEVEIVRHAIVPMKLLSHSTFAERLLFDGHTTMPGRIGLQLCAAVDAEGHVAPWREYMGAFQRERERDNTLYGDSSERRVAVSWLRGRLRTEFKVQVCGATADLSSVKRRSGTADLVSVERRSSTSGESGALLEWAARFIRGRKLVATEALNVIFDTVGLAPAQAIVEALGSGEFALAFAERVNSSSEQSERDQVSVWVRKACERGVPPGELYRALRLSSLDSLSAQLSYERDSLLELTRAVQSEQNGLDVVAHWLDRCAVASRKDSFGLTCAEALIEGPGWYKCWLRFAIGMCLAESAPASQASRQSLHALRELTRDLRPFVGGLRACDLHKIHSNIAETFRRALALLDDSSWSEALFLLQQVSTEITVSFRGSVGGPLPPQLLLDLVIEGTSGGRAEAGARTLSEITRQSSANFYSDIASLRLAIARFELVSGRSHAAAASWREACVFLAAYGSHKDTTIYELLEPLERLADLDPARVRQRLGDLQALCTRVVHHTDGKETWHAPSVWWRILARVDPAGLTSLVVPSLLGDANEPMPRLEQARVDVWRAHAAQIDPILAAALRLTTDSRIERDDPLALTRLLAAVGSGDVGGTNLAQLLICRADEKQTQFGVSNGNEYIARDNETIERLNLAIVSMELSRVVPTDVENQESQLESEPMQTGDRKRRSLDDATPKLFERGTRGLGLAIREWRRLCARSSVSRHDVARFSNVIGYRLLELAQEENFNEAEAALWALADQFGHQPEMLHAIAEGLALRKKPRLAAIAHTLVWTRSRGGGRWLSFGGETYIEWLRTAAMLDPQTTLEVLGEEARVAVLRNDYGAVGIPRALIHAFSVVEFGNTSSNAALDRAFETWDAAHSVISGRLPRVGNTDDPSLPYQTQKELGSAEDAAIAATLGGLGHPSREQKRRSLLALGVLLSTKPERVASTLDRALVQVTEPATLTWLVKAVELSLPHSKAAVALCIPTLQRLARVAHLSVRAVARRLLRAIGQSAPIPEVAEPGGRLARRAQQKVGIRLIGDADDSAALHSAAEIEDVGIDVRRVVKEFAGERLQAAEHLLPALVQAVEARVLEQLSSSSHQERAKEQWKALASSTEDVIPDAYLALEETIESAVQAGAGAGRAELALEGHIQADPIAYEDKLAELLDRDDVFPLAIENSREPRPNLRPPPARDDKVWSDLRNDAVRGSFIASGSNDNYAWATTAMRDPSDATEFVEMGRYRGWRIIASAEHLVFDGRSWKTDAAVRTYRYSSIELRRLGAEQGLDRAPYAESDKDVWKVERNASEIDLPSGTRPIVGLWNHSHAGLMSTIPALNPSIDLAGWLNLKPRKAHRLELFDSTGVALAMRHWRTEYTDGEYSLPRPTLLGAQLLVRADLFGRLLSAIESASGRLVSREYIAKRVVST